jgi:hypothetical protein
MDLSKLTINDGSNEKATIDSADTNVSSTKEASDDSIESAINKVKGSDPDNAAQLDSLKINKRIIEYFTLRFSGMTDQANTVYDAYLSIEELKRFHNSINHLLKSTSLNKARFIKHLDSLALVHEDIYNNRSLLYQIFNDRISEFRGYYNDFQSDDTIQVVYKLNADYASYVKSVKASVDSLESYQKEFFKQRTYQSMVDTLDMALFRARYDIFRDITFDEQILPKKDELIIDVQYKLFNPEKPKEAGIDTKFEKKFQVRNGAKITFSTGLTFSFGMHDRKYSIIPSDTTESFSMIKEDENNDVLLPNISVLMHVLYRARGTVTAGLSWGLGANVSSIATMNFYLGPSIVIGRDERFIVSGGITAAPVDYLNGKYETDVLIKTEDIDAQNLVQKTFRTGWFIGLSYNLSRQKAETAGDAKNE